ncbi:hypothetical protein ACXWR7_12030, partial [Streptococcus pyogenes]
GNYHKYLRRLLGKFSSPLSLFFLPFFFSLPPSSFSLFPSLLPSLFPLLFSLFSFLLSLLFFLSFSSFSFFSPPSLSLFSFF